MMRSAIKDIFHGKAGNEELRQFSPREQELHRVANTAYSDIEDILLPEQAKLYEKFIEAWEAAYNETKDNLYVEGFKLGLLIGIECMEE